MTFLLKQFINQSDNVNFFCSKLSEVLVNSLEIHILAFAPKITNAISQKDFIIQLFHNKE